jgi:hypothetical protein
VVSLNWSDFLLVICISDILPIKISEILYIFHFLDISPVFFFYKKLDCQYFLYKECLMWNMTSRSPVICRRGCSWILGWSSSDSLNPITFILCPQHSDGQRETRDNIGTPISKWQSHTHCKHYQYNALPSPKPECNYHIRHGDILNHIILVCYSIWHVKA